MKAHIDSQILEYKHFKEMIHIIIEQVEDARGYHSRITVGLKSGPYQYGNQYLW